MLLASTSKAIQWTDIADPTAKEIVVWPNLPSPYNDMQKILGGTVPLGVGWTIYICPYNMTCTPGVDCLFSNAPTAPVSPVLFVWKVGVINTKWNGITITSLYADDKISFLLDSASAILNVGELPTYASFMFSGNAITLSKMNFSTDTADAAVLSKRKSVFDHAPLVFRSGDASGSVLSDITSNASNAVVLFVPSRHLQSIDVTGVTVESTVILTSPHAIGAWLGSVVVAGIISGSNATFDVASAVTANTKYLSYAVVTGSHFNITALGITYYDMNPDTSSGSSLVDATWFFVIFGIFAFFVILWLIAHFSEKHFAHKRAMARMAKKKE